MGTDPSASVSDSEETIELHYQKSPSYKEIHVDGAYAGITPHAEIFLALYAERLPIPLQVTHELVNGQLGNKRDTVSKKGVVRSVEMTSYLRLEVAREVARILNELADKAEARLKERQ